MGLILGALVEEGSFACFLISYFLDMLSDVATYHYGLPSAALQSKVF